MEERVKIVIDDKEYEVEKGKTILQVALEKGIDIPYFCYHPRLSIAGSCRMCIVYWENIKRLVISCNTPVQEGMIIRTHHTSEVVRENQKYLLQALMTRHPLDCPICDKAGECDLQNYGAVYGPQRQIVPISALEKERHELDWESDFLEYHSNRCIVCYRCIRACNEVVSAHALYVEERGFHSNIVPTERPMDTSVCEMCGICVYVCPVGAILSKPFRFWTRSWLLEKENTICTLCPVGCEVTVEYGKGDWKSERKVYRIMPTEELNICARAFFGYDILNTERLLNPYVHGKEENASDLVNLLKTLLISQKGKIAFILSASIPQEILKNVVRIAAKTEAYITAPQTADFFKIAEAVKDFDILTLEDIKNTETFLLIGEDITSTVPVLSYYLKGKVYKIGSSVRDGKLGFQYIDWEQTEKLEGKVTVIVNSVSLEEETLRKIVQKLGIWKKRGYRVFVLPKDGNTLGLFKELKDVYSDLEAVLGMAMGGEITTLVILGEDITEYYEEEMLSEILSKVEHLIVASPFSDGLVEKSSFRIPLPLLGETEGTFVTLLGEVKGKRFLPWSFDAISFWKNLADSLKSEESSIKQIRINNFPPKKPKIHLYRNSWITKRSENLSLLFKKNMHINTYKI